MNYFIRDSVAKRYAKSRPYFHGLIINRIKSNLGLSTKLEKALDVACGTGLSTLPLLEIANEVHGTDVSEAMLKHALPSESIHYHVASATEQPFGDEEFDLITVSCGIHWFDIDVFLKECRRLLKPGCCLVHYYNFFRGKMDQVPEFEEWFRKRYIPLYPSPPRYHDYPWTQEHVAERGFELLKSEDFDNEVNFNQAELSLYFTSQSNITAALEKLDLSYEEIEEWLKKELEPFWDKPESKGKFFFGNRVRYLKRI